MVAGMGMAYDIRVSQPLDARSYTSLGELLRDAVIQHKRETALVECDRKRRSETLTFADVKERGLALARALQDRGVGPGDRVAVVMSNQSKWLLTAWAAFYRGAVLVPLDYKLSASEQESLLAHCGARWVVTEYPMWRRFRELPPGVSAIVTEAPERADLGAALRFEDLGFEEADDAPAPTFEPRGREDLATIVYSSGTGGRPKGCMLSHGAYLAQAESLMELFPMVQGERYFSILPTNHAIDFMCGFVVPFACGATVVHQRTLRPEFILETMKREGITHMALVPLVLTAFERAVRKQLESKPGWVQRAFDTLAYVNGALTQKRPNAALSRMLLKPIHEAFGGKLKVLFCGGAFVDRKRAEFFYSLGLPVVIGYGLTECCTVATVNDLKPFRADSVGGAVAGCELAIAHPDASGVGEVLIRTPTLMSGYLDEPELTADAIDADGWLHTGDLGWLDASQHLHLVGRCKNMIVTEGGKNVYPEDIEGAFEGLPCDELAVFAANYIWPRAELTGEQLVAVVRCSSEHPVNALLPRLRDLNRRLPDFKRVAGIVEVSDEFPRTASMKVKRGVLAEQLRQALDRSAIVEL